MTTKEKILQFIEFKGISKRDFYRQTGLSNGFLDSGKHIGSDNLKIIISNYPELNLDWLVMDNGNMIIGGEEDALGVTKPNVNKNATILDGGENGGENGGEPNVNENATILENDIEQEYRAVIRKLKFAEGFSLADNGAPFYPLPVSAGNAYQLLDEPENPTGYLNIPGVSCKAYFPVIGFSFEPLIRAGDIIGIDFMNSWDRLDPDSIYFIITYDNRMIKRLVNDPKDPDKLICLSPNFKEFSILKEEIRVIHKVIFYGRLI